MKRNLINSEGQLESFAFLLFFCTFYFVLFFLVGCMDFIVSIDQLCVYTFFYPEITT